MTIKMFGLGGGGGLPMSQSNGHMGTHLNRMTDTCENIPVGCIPSISVTISGPKGQGVYIPRSSHPLPICTPCAPPLWLECSLSTNPLPMCMLGYTRRPSVCWDTAPPPPPPPVDTMNGTRLRKHYPQLRLRAVTRLYKHLLNHDGMCIRRKV